MVDSSALEFKTFSKVKRSRVEAALLFVEELDSELLGRSAELKPLSWLAHF